MTIGDIATLAGVSKAAVSRYLNGGYISEQKKSKIKQVIEETGYKPLRQAQMLRTKKTKLIGVILPKINSEAISRVVAGISEVLSEQNYELLLANTDNKVEKELTYLELFKENYVDGIIFIATIMEKRHTRLIQQIKIPVVVVGQHTKSCPCVFHDDYEAMKELTKEMIRKRGTNIGYIGVTKDDYAVGYERTRAFFTAMNECGAKEIQMVCAEFSMESGYNKAKELMTQTPNLKGIVCATDSIAIGAMQYLKEAGYDIPSEVAISGAGHTKMSAVVTPKLTTIHFHYRTSGVKAAKVLIELIEGQIIKQTEEKLGYYMIVQKSTE